MRVIDLENINSAMGNETQFVLRCEEVFHDKISAAAAAILSNRQERPVVALTGPPVPEKRLPLCVWRII